jgi:mono/diheme cytochrome c family protein
MKSVEVGRNGNHAGMPAWNVEDIIAMEKIADILVGLASGIVTLKVIKALLYSIYMPLLQYNV